MSLEARFPLRPEMSPGGSGGGDDERAGGVAERRDLLEFREGVLYGVSDGVGSEAAAAVLHNSSSVSHWAAIVAAHCRFLPGFFPGETEKSFYLERAPRKVS